MGTKKVFSEAVPDPVGLDLSTGGQGREERREGSKFGSGFKKPSLRF